MKILNRLFAPNLTISHNVGFSGGNVWFKRFGRILTISKGNRKTMCLGIGMELDLRDRWCKRVSHGGITLGIGKFNYWISYDCLIGKLINPLF